MVNKYYIALVFLFLTSFGRGQDIAYNDGFESTYQKAYDLVYEGKHSSAKTLLLGLVDNRPDHIDARSLLANTYSWEGRYVQARNEFNTITSKERKNRKIWAAAIKNELYAKNNSLALGLANKALSYIEADTEIERLKNIAFERINGKNYSDEGWYNQETGGPITTKSIKSSERNTEVAIAEENDKVEIKPKSPVDTEVLNNRVDVRNAVTVFDQRYDPMIYSSISYKRQTLAGSLIPRLNYSNRLGKNGLQYDLDFYPKFSKRFYAYLNYGYSDSSIYPKHKFGGDLYANLPGAIEFSAGARHIVLDTKNVSVITNSIGHYRGNYYFSLRSYITPQPDNLTQFSGNLLVRKYLKDAENYFGVNVGMGYSPELRQIISGDELLAETLLYVESQRLSLEYQFTGKNSQNAYRANIGATRQELAFAAGNFFYGISAGITYQVKF